MIEFNLVCIFIILLFILSLKLYLQVSNNNCNCKHKCNCNKIRSNDDSSDGDGNGDGDDDNDGDGDMKLLLNKIKLETEKKINSAIQQGTYEGFIGYLNNDTNDNIISYVNKDEKTKVMLFYKTSCSYCNDFLPIWYKIINNLPKTIIYEEIDIDKNQDNNKKANEYNITTVPTIILVSNNNKQVYIGDRSYKDIERFLKKNKINLIDSTFEEFDDTGFGSEPKPTELLNVNCPAVSFDSNLDVANDDYMFQIFNEQGQYGYAKGSNKPGNLLTPFNASYSVVASYLTSLPDTKNIEECSNLYSKNIRGFGLCDNEKLDTILNYEKNIKNGSEAVRFNNTDYSINDTIVKAIKTSCEL